MRNKVTPTNSSSPTPVGIAVAPGAAREVTRPVVDRTTNRSRGTAAPTRTVELGTPQHRGPFWTWAYAPCIP